MEMSLVQGQVSGEPQPKELPKDWQFTEFTSLDEAKVFATEYGWYKGKVQVSRRVDDGMYLVSRSCGC